MKKEGIQTRKRKPKNLNKSQTGELWGLIDFKQTLFKNQSRLLESNCPTFSPPNEWAGIYMRLYGTCEYATKPIHLCMPSANV